MHAEHSCKTLSFFFFFVNALVLLPTTGAPTAHGSLYVTATGLLPRTASARSPNPTPSFLPGQALPSPVGSVGGMMAVSASRGSVCP